MSSKRRLRRRSCEKKVRYESQGHARAAVRELARKFAAVQCEPYQCHFCGGWHLGRPVGLKAYDETVRMGRRS